MPEESPSGRPEYLNEAERDKFTAEALAAKALARLHEANATKTDTEREIIEIARGEAKRLEADELAQDRHNFRYVFDSQVTETSVKACITQLTKWSRQSPTCEIEVVFNSPGGSVISGMALFDYLRALRESGHKVVTSSIGYAASMAGILLQAGDERVMGREAWLMIHQAAFGAIGKTFEIEDEVEWVKRVQERILDIFTERSQGADASTATRKLTKRQLRSKWHRKDWWISADEALEYGLIDRIR